MRKSNLGLRFGLAVGVILLFFCALVSTTLYYYLKTQVIKDAYDKTLIIMTHVKAVGGYVKDVLRPKLSAIMKQTASGDSFVIEAMSTTHVRNEVMRRFNKDLPGYTYRRVSDRPLNRSQMADGFHLGMIEHFRQSRDTLWNGMVTEGGEKYIVYVLPITSDRSCLACHGEKKRAPKELVARYGTTGYFGWKENTIVGVESVSVPLNMALAHVRRVAIDTFVFGAAMLGMLFIALTGIFRYLVTMPLNNLSATFKRIAEGREPLGKKLPSDRDDEIGDLTESFNLLASHLLEAQERLKRAAAIEKQMTETEKLAALGQLSAGVAHEINNPLGGIKLCFNNLMNTHMGEVKRAQHIEVVNSGFDRIQTIVKNLLDFSKNSSLNITPVSLNVVIENVLSFTEYTIGRRGATLIRELSPRMPDIMADANKLEQVFLNLIMNAVQAMEEGGILAIKTWSEGSVCKVSVSDTGKGIPSDIMAKIYDPFFTTKGVGKGTGLGLTVSKAIIEQHKGRIDARTSDKGTTFTVMLPLEQ